MVVTAAKGPNLINFTLTLTSGTRQFLSKERSSIRQAKQFKAWFSLADRFRVLVWSHVFHMASLTNEKRPKKAPYKQKTYPKLKRSASLCKLGRPRYKLGAQLCKHGTLLRGACGRKLTLNNSRGKISCTNYISYRESWQSLTLTASAISVRYTDSEFQAVC